MEVIFNWGGAAGALGGRDHAVTVETVSGGKAAGPNTRYPFDGGLWCGVLKLEAGNSWASKKAARLYPIEGESRWVDMG
jgi:hypothetical protein